MVIPSPFAANADYHSDAPAEEQPAGEESAPEGKRLQSKVRFRK